MDTSNRVSALIQTLEKNAEASSRASLSRSPSQTPYCVTPEKPRSLSIRGDIIRDDIGHQGSGQEPAPQSGPRSAEPIIEEMEVPLQVDNGTKGGTNHEHSQTVSAVELSKTTHLDNERTTSDTASDRSESSFESPIVLSTRDQGYILPFNRPVSVWNETDWPGSTHPEAPQQRAIATSEAPVSPSFVLQSQELDPAFPRRSATVPPRRPTSFIPTTLDTLRAGHWGTNDVLGTPYPGRGRASVIMPESSNSGFSPQRRTLRKQPKQEPGPSATIPQVMRHSDIPSTVGSHPTTSEEDSLLVSVRDSCSGVFRRVPLFIPRQAVTGGKAGRDDEELAFRMRDSYLALRGPWKTLFVARGVVGVSIIPHPSAINLPSTPVHPDQSSAGTGTDAEKGQGSPLRSRRRPQVQRPTSHQLFTLFHNPSRGRGRSRLVEAVGDAARAGSSLQLVEGWTLSRISFAVVLILLASVAVTLLWIFIGVGARAHLQLVNAAAIAPPGSSNAATSAPLHVVSRATRDVIPLPADRVGPAAILGGLVLLLGWTAVGGWMFLSYLVT